MHDLSAIMWLTNEEWEANNGRNANVYTSLFGMGGGGCELGVGGFVQTWIVSITEYTMYFYQH
jgi:hypothetical protein